MMPYGCLATGYNVGMIEVVRDSKTVMKILEQNIRGAMQVSSRELHRWIKDKNKGDKWVYGKGLGGGLLVGGWGC